MSFPIIYSFLVILKDEEAFKSSDSRKKPPLLHCKPLLYFLFLSLSLIVCVRVCACNGQ